MPLLSVFPPLRISVCKLLVSGSLHFAIYLKRPGKGTKLRVSGWGESEGREGGREGSRKEKRRHEEREGQKE